MEIELGPFPKYESIRYNAYWSRKGIDTRFEVDEDVLDTYKAHLKDCENKPTVGMLARKKYITGKPMNYSIEARRNLHYMHRQPEVKELRNALNNKINELYPRTKHIRKYITDTNRVVLDYVEKARKYTVFNKLKIALKRFI